MLPPTRRTSVRPARAPAKAAAAPGKIRIIGGHLRNSRLAVPDLPGLRPTPERVRETLFNWLNAYVGGARCLDLFAGTGALGMEALSRGAAEVVFVERDAGAAAALRDNLLRLKQARGRVANDDALGWLRRETSTFDLVFLDPPFAAGLWAEAANLLQQRGLLAPAALIYVESPADIEPPLPADWLLHRQGRSGEVRHVLYRRGAALA
ncbi:16S rRNA m(2)G-966 methyltransferase [Tahibacter aquaticus]|uniref:Ribosomal RNA small subunit methyltransferase D n=1 Tax=Tahibacter aquaticus TaxID=520092 RepID=A0A4R6YR78_9GAMM|nr:16S rRNA (guanine(966)-N(2))-methyltransferase RsmD [Tahibacter aquaticus]TDR40458.1 16S rRNA m(2)G-966 methyltransferase [Tahibacter aquaticus]